MMGDIAADVDETREMDELSVMGIMPCWRPWTRRVYSDLVEQEAEILRLKAENAAHRETNLALVAEIERLRGELDQACTMFSKYTWTGRLDMPREFHLIRGRRMAGLKDGYS
jgi:hypothetical protein